MMHPNKLYKYESFTTQSLANLKNGNIYFSTPNQFNDPFDCSLPLNIDFGEDSLSEIRDYMLEKNKDKVSFQQQIKSIDDASLKVLIQGIVSENLTKALTNKGISCFSTEVNNLLMWSHYGSKHRGFCLEFDTSAEPFNRAVKVKYVDNFPIIPVEELVIKLNFKLVIELLHTKSNVWSYENEWRCIHDEAPLAYTYNQNSLTGVYFGAEMDDAAIEIICLVLQGQNSKIRFWQAKKCADRFGLTFEEFTYTPHLKSLEKGTSPLF